MSLFRSGPSGGVGGNFFHDTSTENPIPGGLKNSFIRNIKVRHGRFIDSITVTLEDRKTGELFELPRRGDPFGGNENNVQLGRNFVLSALEGISGRFVDSLKIHVMEIGTRQITSHGPFGGVGGEVHFIYEAPVAPQGSTQIPVDTRVAGFFGQAGLFVDQIGVILSRPL